MNRKEIVNFYKGAKETSFYICDRCNEINEKVGGYIFEKRNHPLGIGCNCIGAKYTEVDMEKQYDRISN